MYCPTQHSQRMQLSPHITSRSFWGSRRLSCATLDSSVTITYVLTATPDPLPHLPFTSTPAPSHLSPHFLPLPSTELNPPALILHPLVILKAINEIILESPRKALPGGSQSRDSYLAHALLLPMESAAIRQIPALTIPLFAAHFSC